jgi:N-acetylmuramoyl-L-alanine amidase
MSKPARRRPTLRTLASRQASWLSPLLLTMVALSCSEKPDSPQGLNTRETEPEVMVTAGAAGTEAPASSPVTESPAPTSLAGHRICLDPGHDSYWVAGASGRTSSGSVPRHPQAQIPLVEHELTLQVAYRLKSLLESEGAYVCVTRRPAEEGGYLAIEPYDYTGDGRVRPASRTVEDVPELIQPRIDLANSFRAEILVSIHFNGSEDQRLRGTEVYYTDAGPREAQGRELAQSLLSALTAEMRAAGHATLDRGVRSDRYQRYSQQETLRLFANNAAVIRANGHDPGDCPDCYRQLTLGNNPMSLHRGTYVGALVEVEFLSNPDVVEGFILRPDSLDVIAKGLLQGIKGYFEAD